MGARRRSSASCRVFTMFVSFLFHSLVPRANVVSIHFPSLVPVIKIVGETFVSKCPKNYPPVTSPLTKRCEAKVALFSMFPPPSPISYRAKELVWSIHPFLPFSNFCVFKAGNFSLSRAPPFVLVSPQIIYIFHNVPLSSGILKSIALRGLKTEYESAKVRNWGWSTRTGEESLLSLL